VIYLVSIRDLGELSTSSVDKKINDDEQVVNLVNYMDVYNNLHHTIDSKINFMKVTARDTQIESAKVRKGDVLFTPSSETSDDIGLSAVVTEDLRNTLFSYHLIRLRFMKNISLEFKKYMFHSPIVLNQFSKLSQGATRFTLKKSSFQKVKLPLPPLPEQQKIAAILTSVDKKIEVIDEQIAKGETLKKGLMQKLLSEGIGHTEFKESELGRIPREWEIVRLGDIANVIDPHPSHRAPKEDINGYPFVGIGDISENGDINLEKCRKVSLESVKEQNEAVSIKEGDIGFGRVATVGKVVRFKKYNFPFALSPTMALIKNKNVDNTFLYQYLSSNMTSKQFGNLTSGSTRISLGIQNLRKIAFVLPPLPEQKQIATILSTADEKLETLREKRARYERLKKGLMQKLLTGEVRVQP